jgi:hypothetical protein
MVLFGELLLQLVLDLMVPTLEGAVEWVGQGVLRRRLLLLRIVLGEGWLEDVELAAGPPWGYWPLAAAQSSDLVEVSLETHEVSIRVKLEFRNDPLSMEGS